MTKPDTTTSTKAAAQPSIPLLTKKKPQMEFFPAKGLGSYHCFAATEEKSKKLFRSAALQYGSLSTLPNADQALASVLPRGFVAEAEAHGCSLKDAVTEAQAFYLANLPSPKAKRDVIDYDNILNKKGVPLPTIQKLMRHSRVETTMIYIETREDEMRNAINLV